MRYLIAAAPLMYLAAATHAIGGEPVRAQLVAALFDDYCLSKSGDWSDLDHRATSAHYAVVIDQTNSPVAGMTSRQKNWLVPSANGPPTLLTSVDMTNGPVHVFSCGIYAPDLVGDSLDAALTALPRLGSPTKHSHVDGGALMTWWQARVGDSSPSEDSQVMLAREIPGIDGTAVTLNLRSQASTSQKD